MSTHSASRAPIPATLGEVIDLIQGRSDLQPWLRRDLCSAIRTLCRALGQIPADVPADAAILRRRMKDLSAPAVGLSRGSWRNTKSLVSKALALAGITIVAGRAKAALMPEWGKGPKWCMLSAVDAIGRRGSNVDFGPAGARSR